MTVRRTSRILSVNSVVRCRRPVLGFYASCYDARPSGRAPTEEEVGAQMITMTGYAYGADAHVVTRLTAPIPASFQGRGLSAAGAAGTAQWRLRGKRATTPFDSESGALPA